MVLIPDLAHKPGLHVLKGSLRLAARTHSLRCDAKQAEARFQQLDELFSKVPHFRLGDFLPGPMMKGEQPAYQESLEPEGVAVINTLSIQRLQVVPELCRFISEEEYERIDGERKPRKGDVLVTVDGGTSIGKPVYFDLPDPFAVDSHVAILRPQGVSARLLVYLLASPLGQVQFQQAESGASGQTGVSEEDIRRFRFPRLGSASAATLEATIDAARSEISELQRQLEAKQSALWKPIGDSLAMLAKGRK